MLWFEDGRPFATGAVAYEYRPVHLDAPDNRIILPVSVEGLPMVAVLDTGAPYLILAPAMASLIGLRPAVGHEPATLSIRGTRLQGYLCRVRVELRASRGAGTAFEATAFAPNPGAAEAWGDLPSFLGIHGCLDRLRFAIDPLYDTLYFGALS